MSDQPGYPLVLEPILKEKVWGGRRLERFGKEIPEGIMVGESWELADLASTSPSGGGGGEARSVIANGSLAGSTLSELVKTSPDSLLGDAPLTPQGDFPLLVKLLDARQHLSVQVHPTSDYAAAHPGAHTKTESWYVAEAEPGAVIFKGTRDGVTRDSFSAAIKDGSVVELLDSVPARPGDCHHLPSGTLHALGAGVVVAEIQTPSDTTFRVYDWAEEYGRSGRPLHIEEALECIDFGPPPAVTRLSAGALSGTLVETDAFSIREFRSGDEAAEVSEGGRAAVVLLVLSGELVLSAGDGSFADVALERGATALVPAAIVSEARISAPSGGAFLGVRVGSAM